MRGMMLNNKLFFMKIGDCFLPFTCKARLGMKNIKIETSGVPLRTDTERVTSTLEIVNVSSNNYVPQPKLCIRYKT